MTNKISSVLFLLISFPVFVFAYEPTQTHPGITEQVIEFYNAEFSKKITNTQKNSIIKGSTDEDEPATRALNHFFDPIRNIGIEGGRTAKDWATIDTEANQQSWDDAIAAYARGDSENAFIGLGHVLHLVEDMGVPDHTRNDQHLPYLSEKMGGGSPYEEWAMGHKNRSSMQGLAMSLVNERVVPKQFSKLGEYFDFLANYSNKNFFSRDTIRNSVYKDPQMQKLDSEYVYSINNLTNQYEPILFTWRDLSGERTYSLISENRDTRLLSSYFDRLARQMIPSGAGVIDLFLKEGEKAKVAYQEDLRKKQEAEILANAALAESLSHKGLLGLIASGAGFLIQDNIVNPLNARFLNPVGKAVASALRLTGEQAPVVLNTGKFAAVALAGTAGEVVSGVEASAVQTITQIASLTQSSFQGEQTPATESVPTELTPLLSQSPVDTQANSPVAAAIEAQTNTATPNTTATSGSQNTTQTLATPSLGGGGGALRAPETSSAGTGDTGQSPSVIPSEPPPSSPSFTSGVTPESPVNTILSNATTTFSGKYSNTGDFDSIVFALKNITTDTATSSISRALGTTTGEHLPFSEDIILESGGDWQYQIRLEGSTQGTSTPWSSIATFSLSTSTATTTVSVPALVYASGLFGQTDDVGRSQSHPGTYLAQSSVHAATDPTWEIKKIVLKLNPLDDNNLSVDDCKIADLSFPEHGGAWNGTQNNISAQLLSRLWVGVTITADDTTKTCTYQANFGNLVTLSSGTEYDMVLSAHSWAGGSLQVYGSLTDTAPGNFGYFSYMDNAHVFSDGGIADAFFEFATSTESSVVEHITPVSPVGVALGTSTVAFSGTYRDTDGLFNVLRIDVEATSTANSMSTGGTFSIPVTAGTAVPFSQTIDLGGAEPMGARWRVQAWSSAYWGMFGYATPWNGTTGYSDWQYFTIEPAITPVATTTDPIIP